MNVNLRSLISTVCLQTLRISFGGVLSVSCLSGMVFAQEKSTRIAPEKASAIRPFSFVPSSDEASTIIQSAADSVFAKAGLSTFREDVEPPKATIARHWGPPVAQKRQDEDLATAKMPADAPIENSSESPASVVEAATNEAKPDETVEIPEASSSAPGVPTAAPIPEATTSPEPTALLKQIDDTVAAPQSTEAVDGESSDEDGNDACLEDDTAGSARWRTPVRNILGTALFRLKGDDGVNAVGHFSLLSLARDYRGDGRALSSGIPNLFANGPDEGDFTGFDIGYGRRRKGGKGWELRFLSFNPDEAVDIAGSSPTLVWAGVTDPLVNPNTPAFSGLSGIGVGAVSMADVFDDAVNHRVIRDSQFGSVEFNLLRASAGGAKFSCGNSMVEFTGGLRAVSFDESISFAAGATSAAGFPSTATYTSEIENELFGLQIGARLERQFTKGWGYTFGTKVGIYNNRISGNQRAEFRFSDGSVATPQVLVGADAGTGFDFSGTDNELAFLGELDLGVIYQFSHRARARVGYRGIAVTNVAAAATQLESNLFDVEAVAEPKAWDDLIVGGLYFGVDYGF